jgi:mono/diheme cytochrome c family protein
MIAIINAWIPAMRLSTRGAAMLLCSVAFSGIAMASERTERGRALLEQHCGSCHAIEKVGRSPHREAPPFRHISRRYDIDVIAAKLREGLVSSHRDMPDFRFSREDARAAVRLPSHAIMVRCRLSPPFWM